MLSRHVYHSQNYATNFGQLKTALNHLTNVSTLNSFVFCLIGCCIRVFLCDKENLLLYMILILQFKAYIEV